MYLIFFILISISLSYISNADFILGASAGVFLVVFIRGEIFSTKRIVPYLMLFTTAFIVVTNNQAIIDLVVRSKPFVLTVIMIISVTLVSVLIKAESVSGLYRLFSEKIKNVNAGNTMMYSAALTAPFLNMATPVIYGKIASPNQFMNSVSGAISVKNGMMISMLVAPTFAPIALVISSHPEVSWANAAMYSLPLMVVTIVFYSLFKAEVRDSNKAMSAASYDSSVYWILLYVCLLLLSLVLTDKGVVVSIIQASIVTVMTAIVAGLVRGESECFHRADKKVRETMDKINNEAIIFIISGLLIVSVSELVKSNDVLNNYMQNLHAVFVILLVILVLPVISLFKMHPIIGFTLLQPLVYINTNLVDLQKYMLWVCYWVVSLQISPLSVVNIATSNAFNLPVKSIASAGAILKVYFLAVIYCFIIYVYGGV